MGQPDSKLWADYSPSLRAMLDEYARAIRDYELVMLAVPRERYSAATVLSDKEFAHMQNIAEHVIGASHGYANYINDALDKTDRGRQQLDVPVSTPQDAVASTWEGFLHMVKVLGRIKDWSDEQQEELHFVTRWKQTYNVEQIIEHAIVHILRHRRQLERWRDAELV